MIKFLKIIRDDLLMLTIFPEICFLIFTNKLSDNNLSKYAKFIIDKIEKV